MYKIVVLLVSCLHALSQPVTNEPPAPRLARQLAECCPCPGSSNAGQDTLVESGQLAREAGLDDCPCRPRGADSEGASSSRLPSAVLKDEPLVRQNDLKDDLKNLLEPEVTLATSMLDTLQRATEEEYQDALARDAAKSAAESDSLPEESARNVVIIMNPKDSDDQEDIISEASQVQESRCIYPLETTSLGKKRKSLISNNVFPDTLGLSYLKRPSFLKRKLMQNDSDLDASNVQESTIGIQNTPIFQSQTPTLKLKNTFKSIVDNDAYNVQPTSSSGTLDEKELSFSKIKSQNNMFSTKDALSNIEEQTEATDKSSIFKSQTPTLMLRNTFKSIVDDDAYSFKPTSSSSGLDEKESSFATGENIPLVPKLKSQINMLSNNDLTFAPSHMQEQPEVTNNKTSQHSKLPLNLSQLLKLKDVELIPNTISNRHLSKSKLDTSKFKIPTLWKENENENNFDDNYENVNNDRTSKNIWNKQETKINALRKVIRPFNKIKENLNSKSDDYFFDDSKCKFTKEYQENLVTMLNPSQVRLPLLADFENEREVDVTSQNTTENDRDYSFLKFRELANNNKNEVKENQVESKEIISEIITDLVQETGNKNDDQNIMVKNASEKQVFNTNKDLKTESSNNVNKLMHLNLNEKQVIYLLPQNQENSIDDIEALSDQQFDNDFDAYDEIKPVNLANPLDKIEIVPQFKTIPPLSKTSSNIQENIASRYESFKIPSVNSESSRISHNSDNLSVPNETNRNIHNNNPNSHHNKRNKIATDLHQMDTIEPDIKETINYITMKDLQDMSDKLFASNSKKQNNKTLSKIAECNTESNEANRKSNELYNVIDNKSSEANLDPVNAENSFMNGDKNDKYVKESVGPTIIENINKPGNQEQSFKSAGQETKPNEMDVGASDTVVKTLPSTLDPFNFNSKLHSPLLENIIAHASQDPLSLLKKPLDVLNLPTLNANLPTLDDLKERLTNIFNTNDRSAEDDSSSFESDCTNDYAHETMTPEASTTNSQIKLPSLKQLTDLNVDIFRTKPITSSTVETLSPRHNLNSYPTKVSVPRKMELKPVKMESRLIYARKVKPSNSEARLESFPTVDDMRNIVRYNSKKLLSSSSRPNLNLFTDNFHSNDIGDIADTIRLNTQNTMKTLRQRIKSTLRKTKTNNELGNPFAKPQELLEDVSDKLKGIKYDLNDRLSSIHDNIMDSPQIKTLVNQPRNLGSSNDLTNIMINLRQNKAKTPPSRLQKATNTVTTQKINSHNSKQRDFTTNTEPRRFIKTNRDKLHNIQTAAESSPTPVRIDMPKSASLSYLQKPTNLLGNPTITKSFFTREPINLKDVNRPILRTSVDYFKKQPKRVTVSFETTTRPVTSPEFDEYSQSILSTTGGKSATERDLVDHTWNPAAEIEVLPKIFKSLRSSASVPSSYDENYIKDRFSLEKYPMRSLDSRSSVLKKMADSKTQGHLSKFSLSNIFENSKETTVSASRSLVKPKVNENISSSRVRDSDNLRLLNRHPKLDGNVKTKYTGSDMLKSPSDNTDIVIDEPLKENVSYKCRMVCTKVINK